MELTNLVTVDTRAVLLVEGESDRAAVETTASRSGVDLAGGGVHVVAMGGATNIGHYLSRLGDVPVIGGLYDAPEERVVRRSLERAGVASSGFFACVRDLEDEFIRALGPNGVLDVIKSEGELGSFQTLQHQPDHRGSPLHDQLHRFIGTRAQRKIRYGRLLAEAVPVDRIPPPLVRLLDYVQLRS